jgi:hypothetical protein
LGGKTEKARTLDGPTLSVTEHTAEGYLLQLNAKGNKWRKYYYYLEEGVLTVFDTKVG